jgi:hypothetical protein
MTPPDILAGQARIGPGRPFPGIPDKKYYLGYGRVVVDRGPAR